MTDDTPFDLPAVCGKKLTVDFDGGNQSSDAGLLLREALAIRPHCLPLDWPYTKPLRALGAQMPRSAINPTDKHVGSRVRMRPLMLGMSQSNLADAPRADISAGPEIENGLNRISASRLQHISQILQVPVPFFFEGAPAASGVRPAARGTADAPSLAYVSDFFATSDGLSLVKAFMRIEDPQLRRAIVQLVEEIVPETA
jgi:transcriptional regulator with XRE-family HTH domain